jgi:hypothetical protein
MLRGELLRSSHGCSGNMAYLSTKRPAESKIHDKALGSRKSSTILAALLSCMLCDMAANTIKLSRNGRDIIPHFPCVDLIQGVKRVRAASPWSECYLKRAMIWAYAVKAHGNAPAVPGQDAFTRPELFCTDMY